MNIALEKKLRKGHCDVLNIIESSPCWHWFQTKGMKFKFFRVIDNDISPQT